MNKEIQNLVKQAIEFFGKSTELVKNLPEELLSGQYDEDIMKLEDMFDERYPDLDRGQDIYDFKDDLGQPGFVGAGLVKDKDGKKILLGYLYGYRFIYGDNWDEETFDDANWYVQDPVKEREELRSAAKNGKIVYISNLVIEPLHRLKLVELLKEVIRQIKEQGYRYVAMEALEDSFKLLMGFGGKPNFGRLNKFGFELVMYTEYTDGQVVILKVK